MPKSDESFHMSEPEEAPRKRTGQTWESFVDEQIRAAQERGEFEHLPGTGRPLQLDVNPLAGARALGFSLLKGQGVAPQEVELGREIDNERNHAENLVVALRRRRDNLRSRRVGPFASERRAYNVYRAKLLHNVEQLLRESNSKALSLSIIAPSLLHRSQVDVEGRIAALRMEFPSLAE